MKTLRILFTSLIGFCCLAAASVSGYAQLKSEAFYVTSPVSVRMPIQGDSTNFTGGKFGVG